MISLLKASYGTRGIYVLNMHYDYMLLLSLNV
jgi:hypothetical protein